MWCCFDLAGLMFFSTHFLDSITENTNISVETVKGPQVPLDLRLNDSIKNVGNFIYLGGKLGVLFFYLSSNFIQFGGYFTILRT